MLLRQFADNRIYDISREIKRIKKRGRHHSKDVGASNRHNLRLHRILGTRQKRAVHNWNHRPSEIFWRNDRLFARHCRLILKKSTQRVLFCCLLFWSKSCLTQLFANPTMLFTMTAIFGWRTRKARLGTKPNVHLVHDFGASRAWRSYSPNSAVIVWRRDKLNL